MKSCILPLFAACISTASAAVSLQPVFADHMVLQREIPVPFWGRADAGEEVTVEFAGQKKTVLADAAGNWSLKLDALKPSDEARSLTVRGKNVITISDVLVGEVWLASGQSNMGFILSNAHDAATELPAAGDPQLRFFTVTKAVAAQPQTDLRGKWELSTPETAKSFSAVAYYFARDLREKLKCPVAILHSSWGGTPGQAWLSLDAIRQEPPLTRHAQAWEAALLKYQDVQANPQKLTDYAAALKQWQTEVAPAFNAAMKEYNAAKVKGPKPIPSRPEPANPDPMGMPSPSSRPGTPSVIFNAMIAPLSGYAMRGALWYQGEANGSAGLDYRTLLPRLISDWRTRWRQGDFPFLVVQLPGCEQGNAPVEQHGWPWLREAQLFTTKVPNVGLAVTIDVGDPRDVHPKGKRPVGHRLALAARKIAYGEKVAASGPVYREAKVEGAAIRVAFDATEGGLKIGQSPWLAEGVEQFPADRLIGFVVAGEDHRWVEAEARIDGQTVLVSSPQVAKPVAVRYGWANAPRCNLYNSADLPASPFRSDDWPQGK